jgi:hypothetical protein
VSADARDLIEGLAAVIGAQAWDQLEGFLHPDVTWEYPQSGERFRGIANIRAQFEAYPGLEPGTTFLEDVVGGTSYLMTPTYTLVGVQGSGDRAVGVNRVRYPDGTLWYAINFVEIRDGLVWRSRSYFAEDFEAPSWRAPYREAP